MKVTGTAKLLRGWHCRPGRSIPEFSCALRGSSATTSVRHAPLGLVASRMVSLRRDEAAAVV
jgi:hypothetical protein